MPRSSSSGSKSRSRSSRDNRNRKRRHRRSSSSSSSSASSSTMTFKFFKNHTTTSPTTDINARVEAIQETAIKDGRVDHPALEEVRFKPYF